MKVRPNSYVVPADIVSGLGEGNSEAGHRVVDAKFKPLALGKDLGGSVPPEGAPIDVIVAGGEHVLSPEQVNGAGNGDITKGHEALDSWVKLNRKKLIKTLQKLPGPVRD
jgi:hypothetical protein